MVYCFNLLAFLIATLAPDTVNSFLISSAPSFRWSLQRAASKNTSNSFSDFAKFIFDKATDQVNEITGKEEWQPGDLAKWLDSKAKQRLQSVKKDVTSEQDYQYAFGDLTLWATNLAKEKAARFAGKSSADEYELGDITKTIVNKVQSGEYDENDVYLALRVLLVAGCQVVPIANFLPLRGLLSLVNVGLTKDVSGRLLQELTESLEQRIKFAVTGKEDYQFGDLTKDKLNDLVAKFTGKDSYQSGDISRSIMNQTREGTTEHQISDLEKIVTKLEDWDAQFLKRSLSTS